MPHIHVLSEELANRIAAGEVVERPASVVKELVENSLDAGARRIEVDLADGGRKLIRVRDDGCGMSADDAVLAVQRFATSKIEDAGDLEAIATMGFRGEALPSIGAVSHLRILTREPDNPEGCEVLVRGGAPPEVRPAGCPAGTTVEVADLFFNTPARLKFLATSTRERGHCADWVTRLALAHPQVAFKLSHEGDVLFNVSGAGDLRSVLAAAYGSAAAREFLPVEAEAEGLCVHGLISGPKLLRATREHQMFFVNRRFVRSRAMGHALNEAYGLLLPAGRHPLCALHLTVDPRRVDPNVHPTKIEVRFLRGGAVHEVVQRAAEQALADAGFRSLSQRPRHVPPADDPQAEGLRAGRFAPPDFDVMRRARRLRINPFEDRTDERDDGLEVYSEPTSRPAPDAAAPPLPVDLAADRIEVLGQLGNRYLVARWTEGLLLIDQHRAAERVFLERLGAGTLARQLLAVPETLELTPGETAAARDNRALLADMGYDLEDFGGDALLVRSVPAALAETAPVEVLRNVIAELAEWDTPTALDRRREHARISAACHAAAKAGRRMNMPEMQRLVDDLMQSTAPAVCPHGDPIIVSFSLERLDREFKRKGQV